MTIILQEATAVALKLYTNKITLIESPFLGLPYAHSTLIKALISLADLKTGIVSETSYNDLAKLLTVNPAPGRKESGTPSKQTIRNWIKSIEKECGDHFKVISEGQNLRFVFPDIPKIMANMLSDTEVNMEQDTAHPYENIDETTDFNHEHNSEVNTVLTTELNPPRGAVKKLFININNNNKTNNNTLGEVHALQKQKQTIAVDFYPSPQTIARGLEQGYSFATDKAVIQEFIDKNTAWGSTYADFNPIYLRFLAEHAKRTLTATEQQHNLRSFSHEHRSTDKPNPHEELIARVKAESCPDGRIPTYEELFPTSKVNHDENNPTPHYMAVGGVHQDLRQAVYEQVRN